MIKDYSGGMVFSNSRNRIVAQKRKKTDGVHELLQTTKFIQKIIGVMMLLTLVFGISSTVWYGLKVQVALDQIGNSQAINTELQDENKLLVAQRDLLLTQNHLQQAAKKLGLVPPDKNQLRYR